MALVLAACGSDDDGEDAADVAPTANASTSEAGERPFGRGVTEDAITIGIGMIEDGGGDDINAEFGTDIENPDGTARDYLAAVVDYMNEQGGLAGHKIEVVIHQYSVDDALSIDGRRQIEQEMCARFTEDEEVFAMLPGITHEGIIIQCGADADTPVIPVAMVDRHIDSERASAIGQWYYAPNWMTTDRREATLVERLVERDWLSPDAKVGIMMQDTPEYRAGVDNGMKPALEAAGIDVVAEVAFPDAIESPWETYVLQFKEAGVTHVLWSSCSCGAGPGLFLNAAETQQWRVRHAFGSEHDLGNLVDLGSAAQLEGASGIGWFPPTDLKEQPEEPANESVSTCRKIASDSGYAENTTSQYCEFFFFLEAALELAPSITSEGLMAGVESLGDDYIPVTTPAASFGPGRHDGAAAVWDLDFDDECGCFAYASEEPHPIG